MWTACITRQGHLQIECWSCTAQHTGDLDHWVGMRRAACGLRKDGNEPSVLNCSTLQGIHSVLPDVYVWGPCLSGAFTSLEYENKLRFENELR
jgi:hypothetical protein